jgi:hypothetical protein
MKSQIAKVFQGLIHLLHLAGGHEANRIPVPFEVQDAVVKPHRPVRGDQVVGENTLTTRRDVHLLGTLLEVHFRCRPVPTLDVDGGVAGQVDNEMSLAKLIDSLLDGHHFKGAQLLRVIKSLHV